VPIFLEIEEIKFFKKNNDINRLKFLFFFYLPFQIKSIEKKGAKWHFVFNKRATKCHLF